MTKLTKALNTITDELTKTVNEYNKRVQFIKNIEMFIRMLEDDHVSIPRITFHDNKDCVLDWRHKDRYIDITFYRDGSTVDFRVIWNNDRFNKKDDEYFDEINDYVLKELSELVKDYLKVKHND